MEKVAVPSQVKTPPNKKKRKMSTGGSDEDKEQKQEEEKPAPKKMTFCLAAGLIISCVLVFRKRLFWSRPGRVYSWCGSQKDDILSRGGPGY